MKKTLAILLTLALVICMIPSTAFAATEISADNVKLSASTVVYNGKAQEVGVVVTVGETVLTTSDYSLTYSNNTEAGTATVKVVGTSGYSGEVSKNFTITKLNIADIPFVSADITTDDIDLENKTLNSSGMAKIRLNPTGISESDLMNLVRFESKYTAATSSQAATVEVIAKAKDENNPSIENTRTKRFDVKTDISTGFEAKMSSNLKFTYTGKKIEPSASSVKVTKTENGKTITLNSSTDYTIAYNNNINGNTYANAVITGKGKYTGSFTQASLFKIEPKSIKNTSIQVSNALVNQAPTVVVRDNGVDLKEGTDYTVIVNTGDNTVTVYGENNYCENVKYSFSVVDKTIESVEAASVAVPKYNGAVQHAPLTVKGSDGKTLTRGTDYSIKYSYTDPITLKNETTDSPKNAGTYAYTITGKGKYAGTFTGGFSINPLPLDCAEIVLGANTVLQNGVYVPKVTLKRIDGNMYFEERDYKVTYRNIGSNYTYAKPTAVVTAVAGGNLSSSTIDGVVAAKTELTKEFTLNGRSLSSNCRADFSDYRKEKNYDGQANFKPPITVRDNSLNKILTENLDYRITYKNSDGKVVYALKDAGSYTITIEGMNGYTGTLTLTYKINGTNISGYTVTLKESSVKADGLNKIPSILSVKNAYYSVLGDSDYVVSYQDSTGKTVDAMKTPGTYKVVVTGKNGYEGSTSATFKIIGLEQTLTGVEGSYKVYPTSDSFKLTPKASEGTFVFTSSDLTVASVSNEGVVTMHKPGRAKITITTTGNIKYNPVNFSTVIKVYPSKAKITKKPWTDGKSKQFKVRWNKQEGVTRYEVRYSRNKSFKSGTYKTKKVTPAVNSYTTQSTTIKNLYSGNTYYVKVRAVKEVYNDSGEKITYYGSWSPWRSVKVK